MPFRPPLHRPAWGRPRAEAERLRKTQFDTTRPSAWKRGYDDRWSALRRKFLMAYPWCQYPGCCQPATEVDHKTPIRVDPASRLDWSNLQALCKPHHSAKTAAETLNRR
jgi:5-methylcytosine-specific restriction endonuclease McrA